MRDLLYIFTSNPQCDSVWTSQLRLLKGSQILSRGGAAFRVATSLAKLVRPASQLLCNGERCITVPSPYANKIQESATVVGNETIQACNATSHGMQGQVHTLKNTKKNIFFSCPYPTPSVWVSQSIFFLCSIAAVKYHCGETRTCAKKGRTYELYYGQPTWYVNSQAGLAHINIKFHYLLHSLPEERILKIFNQFEDWMGQM